MLTPFEKFMLPKNPAELTRNWPHSSKGQAPQSYQAGHAQDPGVSLLASKRRNFGDDF